MPPNQTSRNGSFNVWGGRYNECDEQLARLKKKKITNLKKSQQKLSKIKHKEKKEF